LIADLLTFLSNRLMHHQFGRGLADNLGTREFGQQLLEGTADLARFRTQMQEVQRQFNDFVHGQLSGRSGYTNTPGFRARLNRAFSTQRGRFFELVVRQALGNLSGGSVHGEFLLHARNSPTKVDVTFIVQEGGVTHVHFFELKTGPTSQVRVGQSALQRLVNANPNRPDLVLRGLRFDSTVAQSIRRSLPANATPANLQFHHHLVQEFVH
jgi:hypothetical protein